MRTTFRIATLFVLGACVKRPMDEPRAAAPDEVARALAAALLDGGASLEDPATCAGCHSTVAAEFQQSMHARAHHTTDPVYAALRSFRLAREGTSLGIQCAQCHSPEDTANEVSEVGRRGVTCTTCHQFNSVHAGQGLRGAQALERGPRGMLRGASQLDAGASPIHATGPALPALADGTTVCLACHGEETNRDGVSSCATGVENARAKDRATCTSCHMVELDGPSGPASARHAHRSHSFSGLHRLWDIADAAPLARGARLSGRFEGVDFIATLDNGSGHSFPTGFPARMAVVVMRGLDAHGDEVWRNVTSEPLKEHPASVLNKVYLDGDGGVTLAPYGVRLARDNRLRPDEHREIVVAVPRAVVSVELSLRFWLVAPPAASKLGLTGPETKPRDVARISVSR